MSIYLSIYLSLSLSIYIYIYIHNILRALPKASMTESQVSWTFQLRQQHHTKDNKRIQSTNKTAAAPGGEHDGVAGQPEIQSEFSTVLPSPPLRHVLVGKT